MTELSLQPSAYSEVQDGANNLKSLLRAWSFWQVVLILKLSRGPFPLVVSLANKKDFPRSRDCRHFKRSVPVTWARSNVYFLLHPKYLQMNSAVRVCNECAHTRLEGSWKAFWEFYVGCLWRKTAVSKTSLDARVGERSCRQMEPSVQQVASVLWSRKRLPAAGSGGQRSAQEEARQEIRDLGS